MSIPGFKTLFDCIRLMLLRRPNVLATKVYFASGITLDNYFFPPMGKVALIETRSSSGSIDLYVSEPGDVHFQLLKVARIGSERRAIKWRGNDFQNFRLNEPNPGKGNSTVVESSQRRTINFQFVVELKN